jgi:hypothetical protein
MNVELRFVITKKNLSFEISTDFKEVAVTCLGGSDKDNVIAYSHRVIIQTILVRHPDNPQLHLMLFYNKHNWSIEMLDAP